MKLSLWSWIRLGILLPLAAVVLGLALANREPVTIHFDPSSMEGDSLILVLPLYILVLGVFFAGFICGAFVSWVHAGRHRKAARAARRELKKVKANLSTMILTPSQTSAKNVHSGKDSAS